jgi:molybdopterin converting factor subunit 1
MCINVKLFAIVRERAGADEVELSLPSGATIEAAQRELAVRFPPIADLLPRAAFAVNQAYAPRDTILNDGDELAVIPPVSGG